MKYFAILKNDDDEINTFSVNFFCYLLFGKKYKFIDSGGFKLQSSRLLFMFWLQICT